MTLSNFVGAISLPKVVWNIEWQTKKDRSIFLHDKARDILQHYYNENCKPTHYIFPLLDSSAEYAKAITPEQKATLPPDMIIKLNDIVGANALLNKYLNKLPEKPRSQSTFPCTLLVNLVSLKSQR